MIELDEEAMESSERSQSRGRGAVRLLKRTLALPMLLVWIPASVLFWWLGLESACAVCCEIFGTYVYWCEQ